MFLDYPFLDLLAVLVVVFVALPLLDPDETTMGDSREGALAFLVEWSDPAAQVTRKFSLSFFPTDNSVEMYDLKLRRLFLSRIHCETVTQKDFYLGNTVVVFSRRLLIKDYASESTKKRLESRRESTFAMLKPDGMKHLGSIYSRIEREGLTVAKAKLTKLEKSHAEFFYAEHSERSFFLDLISYVTSGPVLAMELVGEDAVSSWRRLLGPTDSSTARQSDPVSIRALYGEDKTQNAAHGSDSSEAAKRELSFFFPNDAKSKLSSPVAAAHFKDSTCCVIKPHIVRAGKAGEIIEEIQSNGFNISGLVSMHLKYEHAEEFYEIYKGVVQDYTGMVKQLSSGPCLALEVSHQGGSSSTATLFRELVGPSDPELARAVRPKSLRAKFGLASTEENAIHCTDLPEDAPLEVEYFFKILQ